MRGLIKTPQIFPVEGHQGCGRSNIARRTLCQLYEGTGKNRSSVRVGAVSRDDFLAVCGTYTAIVIAETNISKCPFEGATPDCVIAIATDGSL